MDVVHSFAEARFNQNSVLSIGTFDGVHLAHQKIIGEVVQRARERNGRSVIVTFEPHPKEVVGRRKYEEGGELPPPVELITTHAEKLELIAALGVDLIIVVPFTYEFSRRPFREFYVDDIINRIGVTEVIEGYDHGFGRNREAGLAELLALGKEFSFSVVAEKQFLIGSDLVSSSRIRSYLAEGNIKKANVLLGRRYALSGTVIAGHKRGKTLGFPTANIAIEDSRKLLPRNGVYAVSAVVEGNKYSGLMSVGVLPTFFERHVKVCEVFIYDFESDVYGRRISAECIDWIREERKFTSPEELVREMDNDKAKGRRIFENVQL